MQCNLLTSSIEQDQPRKIYHYGLWPNFNMISGDCTGNSGWNLTLEQINATTAPWVNSAVNVQGPFLTGI